MSIDLLVGDFDSNVFVDTSASKNANKQQKTIRENVTYNS